MRGGGRYLGTWTLPSGNRGDVYLAAEGWLECRWDTPPSPSWSREDLRHWREISWPEVLRAVASATGKSVVGISA